MSAHQTSSSPKIPIPYLLQITREFATNSIFPDAAHTKNGVSGWKRRGDLTLDNSYSLYCVGVILTKDVIGCANAKRLTSLALSCANATADAPRFNMKIYALPYWLN